MNVATFARVCMVNATQGHPLLTLVLLCFGRDWQHSVAINERLQLQIWPRQE